MRCWPDPEDVLWDPHAEPEEIPMPDQPLDPRERPQEPAAMSDPTDDLRRAVAAAHRPAMGHRGEAEQGTPTLYDAGLREGFRRALEGEVPWWPVPGNPTGEYRGSRLNLGELVHGEQHEILAPSAGRRTSAG